MLKLKIAEHDSNLLVTVDSFNRFSKELAEIEIGMLFLLSVFFF
jgi:hypothetical protein